MKPSAANSYRLDLRLREFAQLFNSLDPAPFLDRDLDRDAEEYIESWAMEHPAGSRFIISVHLQQEPAQADAAAVVADAIHHFFAFKAGLARRELHSLLRQGRTTLLIGLAFLTACLAAANTIAWAEHENLIVIGRESLTIIGWVAMWRPIEIFLYEWWPLIRKRRIYESLGRAHVSLLTPQKGATLPGSTTNSTAHLPT